MREIDLRHLDVAAAICCYADPEEGWLVDPGPDSTYRTLLAALPEGWEPRRILLTHIHFDHAGAAGRLARRWPGAEVWVHERGAPHMADPSRLLASAKRIYGADFERLWGEVVPVPAESLRVLRGGERRDGFRVAHTPGHASHHVSYLHEPSGDAFTGDASGVRIGAGPVLPPSMPPEIDRELWLASLDLIAAWQPRSLNPTHFGGRADVEAHLNEMRTALWEWSELARRSTAEAFAAASRSAVAARDPEPGVAVSYERANPPELLWSGWDRYWSKRGEAAAA